MTTPDWYADAHCQRIGEPAATFYADVAGNRQAAVQRAKDICDQCVVRADCLDVAIKHRRFEDAGIWGGTTARERIRIRQARQKAADSRTLPPVRQHVSPSTPSERTRAS